MENSRIASRNEIHDAIPDPAAPGCRPVCPACGGPMKIVAARTVVAVRTAQLLRQIQTRLNDLPGAITDVLAVGGDALLAGHALAVIRTTGTTQAFEATDARRAIAVAAATRRWQLETAGKQGDCSKRGNSKPKSHTHSAPTSPLRRHVIACDREPARSMPRRRMGQGRTHAYTRRVTKSCCRSRTCVGLAGC